MKSGFIGIIGRPNVGKSTLLNTVLGEKIAIATDKPQTTRNTIRGIYTRSPGQRGPADAGVQMVFIDTPGIHRPRNRLGTYMTGAALATLQEVDVVLFLVDGSAAPGQGDAFILEKLKSVRTERILCINKIDLMAPDAFQSLYDRYAATGLFREIFGISALRGTGTDRLLDAIEDCLKEGPVYFPPDMVTDNPVRFLVAELIREKVLLYLDDEVPHGVAVEIESYEEGEDLTRIGAVIYCERKSHKGILIGRDGKKLKGIGKSARLEIEALLGTRVYLSLWVKVRENWRDSDAALRNFGYHEG